LWKNNYYYVIFHLQNNNDALTLVGILESHPNKASPPKTIHGNTVAVTIKYKNNDDLNQILDKLSNAVPPQKISGQLNYSAHMTYYTNEKLQTATKHAIIGYIVTVIGILAVSYHSLDQKTFLDALIPSIGPALTAFYLKIKEITS
jgi:hypothetical protein